LTLQAAEKKRINKWRDFFRKEPQKKNEEMKKWREPASQGIAKDN